MLKFTVAGFCTAVSKAEYSSPEEIIAKVLEYHSSTYRGYTPGTIHMWEGEGDKRKSVAHEIVTSIEDYTKSIKKNYVIPWTLSLGNALASKRLYVLYMLNDEICKEEAVRYRGNLITKSGKIIPKTMVVGLAPSDFNSCFFYQNKWRPSVLTLSEAGDVLEAISISPDPKTGNHKVFKASDYKYISFVNVYSWSK